MNMMTILKRLNVTISIKISLDKRIVIVFITKEKIPDSIECQFKIPVSILQAGNLPEFFPGIIAEHIHGFRFGQTLFLNFLPGQRSKTAGNSRIEHQFPVMDNASHWIASALNSRLAQSSVYPCR